MNQIESSVKWAKLVRLCIALQKPEYLTEAIDEAEKVGETEINAILRAMSVGDTENVKRPIQPIIERLQLANQNEEALTLKLISLMFQASLTEQFKYYPVEQQMEALQSGLESCEEAVQVSQFLNDQACEACFIAMMASGFAEIKQLERAKQFFLEALGIRQELAKTQPQIYNSFVAGTLNNLGYLYIDQNDYEKAISHFEDARNLTEGLLGKLIDITRRKAVFQEFLNVYRGLLICYIKLGRWNEALEIAEQGKSRSVADLLNLKAIRPKNPDNLPEIEDLADRYEQAMAKAQQFESWLLALYQNQGNIPKPADDTNGDDLLRFENEISNFNQSLEKVTNQQRENDRAKDKILAKIREHDQDFPPKTELLKQNEIFALSKESGKTIVLFRVTDKGTFVFIVYPDGTLEHLEKEEFTNQRLRGITSKWLTPYFAFLQNRLMKDFDAFKDGMNPILTEIYDELIKGVHEKLKAKNETDVLFVPSGDLAIFPLHACCWEKDGKLNYLIDDDLTVSYATSVSVFKRAWKLKRERADNFLFITNPDESLHYSDLEVDGIKQTFGVAKEDLRHGKATKETVKAEMQNGYSFYHFSCHGNYDRQDAFDSALKLADGEMTMKEIMETSLGNAWLTTLSACETGVVNFEETSDEHYGLPLGFVFAGCPSVWGTLWSVRDDATSELMKLAYQNIKDKIDKNIKGEIDKAEALRMAQIELKKNPKYNSPYYWAGFQHFGV